MAAYCVQADMLCGKHSRCNIHPSEICLPHDPNIKYGPAGPVAAGQQLDYKVEFENEGDGIAFGVYFTDVLDEDLDDSTLVIGPVKNVADDTEIAPAGTYDPATRTITWFVGEVGPHEGGYTELSVNVKGDAPRGTEIINFGTVYFPSVSETTRTNAIVSIIPIEVCNDDIDNDEDALIDCEDLDCFGPDCLEICGDGMDNDGDGWVDCTDPDSTCPPCPEECTNEIDDDEDGLVDCEDSDCEEDDACDTESPVLSIEDGCGISGGCADVSIRLENVPGTEVFSITCDIGYEIDDLSPRDCLLGPAGEDAGKYISVCDYSVPGLVILEVNSSGGVIGDGIVAYVDAKILASCGSETALTLDCTAKDPFNQDVSVVSEGGVLEVVRVGDLDCDGKVMINEVIKVVRMYLGQDPVDPIADPNCDDGIAISEVIKAINCYLETEACPCSP